MKTTQKVEVIDFQMPFSSMIWFMVQWAIASIPAMFLLGFIYGLLMALLRFFAIF